MIRKPFRVAGLAVLTLTAPAAACMWDYDTLRDEKRGLPGVAEVLAGQWERHSAFFYRHRVEAMLAKLAAHPDDPDVMDNLAVAYEKLGDRDAAVRVMLDKEAVNPGRYTTFANLGTFYIHKGDLDAGVKCLKRALAINPDAHFGREEYQLTLAKFMRAAKVQPGIEDDDFLELRHYLANLIKSATTAPTSQPEEFGAGTDDLFLVSRGPYGLDRVGLKPNVVDGLVGMVRFGTGTSPELYFALGDVLAARGDKNLAVRAYQRALDFGYPRPDAVRAARDKVAEMQVPKGGLDPAVIAAERAAADRWVADYQRFEDDLIRTGKDTDDEASYAPFYATHPRTLQTRDWFAGDVWAAHRIDSDQVLAAVGLGAVALLLVGRQVRQWRSDAARSGAARPGPVHSPPGGGGGERA